MAQWCASGAGGVAAECDRSRQRSRWSEGSFAVTNKKVKIKIWVCNTATCLYATLNGRPTRVDRKIKFQPLSWIESCVLPDKAKSEIAAAVVAAVVAEEALEGGLVLLTLFPL
ncbi:hypothetical protein SAY86_003218 [Trapa natans]|uniref:Uncharacterized protein n=1 Tax=Trapa natans TaxID=22666 RepID=A0AAN7RMK2_TRANT|nr:hypothetical protein SAY86_003218 [Trapa natans]